MSAKIELRSKDAYDQEVELTIESSITAERARRIIELSEEFQSMVEELIHRAPIEGEDATMPDRSDLNRESENVTAYEGGSFRDRPPGKGIYYVIPPSFLKRLASRYEYGDVKYGKTDAFKDGLPVSDCINSIYRHLVDYIDGDNTEDHLAAIAWNIAAIMYYEENKPQWQDIQTRQHLCVEETTRYALPPSTKDK